MGSPVQSGHVTEQTALAAGGATPQTATCDAPSPGLCTVIDNIYASNTAGGVATFATIEIQNNANSAVLWSYDASGGPAAAPALAAALHASGAIYKGKKDIRLKVVATMAGATAMKLAVKYHHETPNE